jgi:AhpD family alkylhydroperoxidase
LCDDDAERAIVDPPLVAWASSELPDGADPAISQSALGEQPEALVAFLRLYGTMWSRGQLEHSIKEVARLRNARVTGCGYCRNVRFSVARDEGLTEDRVALIVDGYEDSALSEREKVVVAYTDTFLREPGSLSDRQRAELHEHFSPGELVELTMGIALFMGFSKIAVTLGQAPADMPTMVVPTPDWAG